LILRAAKHMQNWNRVIPAAIAFGTLTSFPVSTSSLLPTVSAPDVGKVAAEIIQQAIRDDELQIIHVEGQQRYGVQDVAAALSERLGREIKVEVSSREQSEKSLQRGISASLTELFTKANDALNHDGLIDIEPNGEVVYGTTELVEALRSLLP
ncbi:hypothetical protein LX36DRAFT_551680, partial [Colletotrichum falcatum]